MGSSGLTCKMLVYASLIQTNQFIILGSHARDVSRTSCKEQELRRCRLDRTVSWFTYARRCSTPFLASVSGNTATIKASIDLCFTIAIKVLCADSTGKRTKQRRELGRVFIWLRKRHFRMPAEPPSETTPSNFFPLKWAILFHTPTARAANGKKEAEVGARRLSKNAQEGAEKNAHFGLCLMGPVM